MRNLNNCRANRLQQRRASVPLHAAPDPAGRPAVHAKPGPRDLCAIFLVHSSFRIPALPSLQNYGTVDLLRLRAVGAGCDLLREIRINLCRRNRTQEASTAEKAYPQFTMRPSVWLACALVAVQNVSAINNGLGRVPLMGWSTWCTDGSCGRDVCTEEEIHDVAKTLIDTGLQAAGWTTIAMDDCWSLDSRDSTGKLQPDPARFPSGMRNLTDWLHDRGFLAGTYISLGYYTCNPSGHKNKVPGSYPYYPVDAHTLVVDWAFDYVKGDWCDWTTPVPLDIGNSTTWMAGALNSTGVPNRFSFHGIAGVPWTTASGNYARVFSDHHDQWTSNDFGEDGTGDLIGLAGVTQMGAYAGEQPARLGGGYWYPDFDFLMTGGQGCAAYPNSSVHCPGQSDIEYATEFIFWSMSNSVLLFATDPRNMTGIMRQALFNAELIALNQAGGQGVLLKSLLPCKDASGATLPQPCQVWTRTNSTGAVFAIVYNPNDAALEAVGVALPFQDAGLPTSATVSVRDLWNRVDAGVHTGSYNVSVIPGHGAAALQLVVAMQDWEQDEKKEAASVDPLNIQQQAAVTPRLLAAGDDGSGNFNLYSLDFGTGTAEVMGAFGNLPDSELSGMLAYAGESRMAYLAAGISYSKESASLSELHVPSNTSRMLNTGISVSAMEYDDGGSMEGAEGGVLWATWETAGTNEHLHFGWINVSSGQEMPLVDLTSQYSIPWATFGVSAWDPSTATFYFVVGVESAQGQSFAVAAVGTAGLTGTPTVTLGTPCATNMTIQSLAFDSSLGVLLVTIMTPSRYVAGENVTYSLVGWDADKGEPTGPVLAQWMVPSTEYNVYQASALLSCAGMGRSANQGQGGKAREQLRAGPVPCGTGTAASFVTVDPFVGPNLLWSFNLASSSPQPSTGTSLSVSGLSGSVWDVVWE